MSCDTSKSSKRKTRNVLNPRVNSNIVPPHVCDPNLFVPMMERTDIANPYVYVPGMAMFYPGFTQNQLTQPNQLRTQPGPRSEKENIQPRHEDMWYASQRVFMPQNYGRNCCLPLQMSASLHGKDLTSHNAYNAMYYTPYDIRNGHNLAIQVPDSTPSNLDRLEMFTLSKYIGEINSSILVEKSACGCKAINVPPNNHGVWKIKSNCDLAFNRKNPARKEEPSHEVNDIRDIRGHKRLLHLVTQEYPIENQSVKRSCTTEFPKNAYFRPIKINDDEDYIDVETVGDAVEKDGTSEDPDETSYIDVVGLSDDEEGGLLEKVN